MFGGNPNARFKPPLSPHHIQQQSGTHNNFGAGGVFPGQFATQMPAKGLNLNSLQQRGNMINSQMHQPPQAPPLPGTPSSNIPAGYTVIDPSTSPLTGGFVQPHSNPLTHYGNLERSALQQQSATEAHLAAMQQLYGQQGAHYDAQTALYNQQLASFQDAARRQAEQDALQRQELQRQGQITARNQLITNRDNAQAQLGAPRSGTHMFFGF